MNTANALTVTRTSTVSPDQIDELGHMNVRWYGHNASAATREMCTRIGLADVAIASTYTRHHHEQLLHSTLDVHTGVLRSDRRLRLYHELRNRETEALAATFVHELHHPPVEHSFVELPDHGRPRSLGSVDDPIDVLGQSPSLSEVRSRDLAIRKARTITSEDTGGPDLMPSWLANDLVWGGERFDPEESWIRTGPNGEQIGFASMESRLTIGRLPRVGTRIQSFGATTHVGDKVTQGISWVYDLDADETLVVSEHVSLAFDIEARRSFVMSDDIRAHRARNLHPDLAPR